MMKIGLIAGTGMEVLAPAHQWSEMVTPYGPAYTATTLLGERQVGLIRRHGPGLNVPPHLINYKANIWALREMGIQRVLATAAVGSIRPDLGPGSLAVIHDFIDFTKRRGTTIFDVPGDAVVHTDFSTPYCPEISSAIEKAAHELGIEMSPRVTYLCVDGPRYETPAEIRMYAKLGGEVVGMTGVPEVILARELGMCYGALAIITNSAAGLDGNRPLSHQDVVECMTNRRQEVIDLLGRAVRLFPDAKTCCLLEEA